jgi:glycosyltransferase involved in cell wall biosynthesis
LTRLQLIVPCYNPDEGWVETLAAKYHELQAAIPGVEMGITVVDDGSVKGTDSGSINKLKVSIPDLSWISYSPNRGKGFALRQGVAGASADYYIYTDIDFPYTTESMKAIFTGLLNGADVVVGIRAAEYYDKVPPRRVFISKLLKKFIRNLLNIETTDTQCGLKGFNNKGRQVFLSTDINRFLFDMQFVMYASHTKGLVLKTQTVYSRPGIIFSHMNYKVLIGETFNLVRLVLFQNKKN